MFFCFIVLMTNWSSSPRTYRTGIGILSLGQIRKYSKIIYAWPQFVDFSMIVICSKPTYPCPGTQTRTNSSFPCAAAHSRWTKKKMETETSPDLQLDVQSIQKSSSDLTVCTIGFFSLSRMTSGIRYPPCFQVQRIKISSLWQYMRFMRE